MVMESEILEHQSVTALLRQLSASGTSYRMIAQRAIDPITCKKLDHRYIAYIARGRLITSPSPPRLRALAAGVGVDAEELKRLAAAQWPGYHVHVEHPRDEQWVLWTTVRQLRDEDRQAVRILAEGLLARHEGSTQRGEVPEGG
jgi:hypothetical protein